jgi:hypothetical protein
MLFWQAHFPSLNSQQERGTFMVRAQKWPLFGLALFWTCMGGIDARAADSPPPSVVGGDSRTEAAAPMPAVDPAAPQDASRKAEAAVLRAMQTKLTLRIQDTPIRDVISRLSAAGGLNIWIDVAALTDEGIAADEPMYAAFDDVSIERVLNRILPQIGLTWLIEDEVLKITTNVAAGERFFTRVYNVCKLRALAVHQQPRNAAARPATDELTFVQFGAGDFEGKAAEENELAWLLGAIQIHTGGEWQNINGTGGTLSLVKDLLVVRQTYHMQRQVAALLNALERAADSTLKAEAIEVRPPNYPFAADAAIHQALQKQIAVEYTDAPIRDVVAHLREQTGAAVLIDEAALTEEGVATDEPVTLRLPKPVTAGSALRLILEPLALRYYVVEGALHVTSEVSASKTMLTVVYVVRDLQAAGISREELIKSIREETTGPWVDVEGTGGTLSMPVPDVLMCRQTHKAQSEVARLLEEVRTRLAEVEKNKD